MQKCDCVVVRVTEKHISPHRNTEAFENPISFITDGSIDRGCSQRGERECLYRLQMAMTDDRSTHIICSANSSYT